jgi:hypothetical protein
MTLANSVFNGSRPNLDLAVAERNESRLQPGSSSAIVPPHLMPQAAACTNPALAAGAAGAPLDLTLEPDKVGPLTQGPPQSFPQTFPAVLATWAPADMLQVRLPLSRISFFCKRRLQGSSQHPRCRAQPQEIL